ncbi:MAG: hypothetical protein Q4G71_03000 [Pseudomonadota bacterium]|nr:hypothetical protein [Pseudomonadota bacterium]
MGVGTLLPTAAIPPLDFVRSVDALPCVAKRQGRNQIALAASSRRAWQWCVFAAA